MDIFVDECIRLDPYHNFLHKTQHSVNYVVQEKRTQHKPSCRVVITSFHSLS